MMFSPNRLLKAFRQTGQQYPDLVLAQAIRRRLPVLAPVFTAFLCGSSVTLYLQEVLAPAMAMPTLPATKQGVSANAAPAAPHALLGAIELPPPEKLHFTAAPAATTANTNHPSSPPLMQSPTLPRLIPTPGDLQAEAASQAGHQALRHGEIELAQEQFSRVLQRNPWHIDTLLALASIADQQGDSPKAGELRQRAYEAAPHEPQVIAARLAESSTPADLPHHESRLRQLAAIHPENAATHFTLGNLLAAQARWAEAEKAYFTALQFAPDNPDYLHNLAVSLDHLHQPTLASTYYRRALLSAGTQATMFSRAEVASRLQVIAGEK